MKEAHNLLKSKENDIIVEVDRKGFKGKVRLVCYKINGRKYVLATSLLDRQKFSISALKKLYHARWGVEEFFKLAKHFCRMEQFRSKSIQGIKQEISIFFLLSVLMRACEQLSTSSRFSRKRGRPKQTKPNRRTTFQLAAALLPSFFLEKNVQSQNLTFVYSLIQRHSIRPRPGRSFPRISYQPHPPWGFDRFKKKQQEKLKRLGLPP